MTDDGLVDTEAVVALMPPEMASKVEGAIRGCKDQGK